MTSVDMRDPGAGNPQTAASAHPNLEAQFEVLAPPDPEPWVVPPQLLKPSSVNGEKSPSVCRRVVRLAVVAPFLLFLKTKIWNQDIP